MALMQHNGCQTPFSTIEEEAISGRGKKEEEAGRRRRSRTKKKKKQEEEEEEDDEDKATPLVLISMRRASRPLTRSLDMTERRQPNFSQEETDLLIREVEVRKERLYGTASRAPRPDDVKLAWKEITSILNESNHGLLRTAAQYKKRFNDVRRRAKNKLCCIRKEQQGTRGGAAATTSLSPLEELVASIPTVSREGFGGVEVGISGQPVGKKDGFFEPASPPPKLLQRGKRKSSDASLRSLLLMDGGGRHNGAGSSAASGKSRGSSRAALESPWWENSVRRSVSEFLVFSRSSARGGPRCSTSSSGRGRTFSTPPLHFRRLHL
ncbi:myb-related transcription factor, partner of profilin-like isoform X2 [Phycodurus eques]|uniref:myb-related transcription factor, partner of profilin-like isoform X2 n=1 Tax=Phycodurus eques TaxID=693459 RepID=UPI002ACD5241|nr:myb-related transcription factor, partner of profilin-like isoform X2 [Phycodurus eques]